MYTKQIEDENNTRVSLCNPSTQVPQNFDHILKTDKHLIDI